MQSRHPFVRGIAAVAFLLAVAVAPGAATAQTASGNLLVSTQNLLREYTANGVFVASTAIPTPPGENPGIERARDLVVHPNGDVWVFNGTFHPHLSRRSATTGQWTHWSHPQWVSTNGGSTGGIAVFDDDLFVTSAATAFVPGGLLRFDTATEAFTVFATQFGDGFLDLAIGWDGLLYALAVSEQDVHVFDPDTLQHVRSIALPHALMARGIGVAADGTLLVATWQQGVHRYDANGNLLQTLGTGNRHHDLDLGPCGEVLCGSWNGTALRATAALAAATQLAVGSTTDTFVAFRAPTVPTPAIATTRLGSPPNPHVFHGSGALLGSTWTGTLTPFLPGAFANVVAFGAGPANVPSPFGTYLFDELLTWFVYDYALQAPLTVAIPNDCRLTGFSFVAQAASVSWTTHAMANALDVRISSFE